MAHGQAGIILRHICTILDTQAAKSLTDGQLLERFVERRDESAFGVLMQRHGRLVWSVCRNILHPEQDAEDAFQATFLVLARRAESIRKGESVGSWLYGVAHRVAMKAKKTATKRWRYEQRGGMLSPAATARKQSAGPGRAGESMAPGGGELALKELQAILHEELERLPDKYRAPFVLCCLEGRSRKEVAGELGWKEGTVSSRVAEARRQLQRRLTRRGVALSAVLCATAVVPNAASAALAVKTLCEVFLFLRGSGEAVSTHAAALAEGVVKSMFTIKVKTVSALLLGLGLLGAGAGLAVQQTLPPTPATVPPANATLLVAKIGDQPTTEDVKQSRTDLYGDPLPPGAVARLGSSRLRHPHLADSGFAPNGKTLLTTGEDGVLRSWDLTTGRELQATKLPGGPGTNPTLSPDGKRLVGSKNRMLVLWDLNSGKELASLAMGNSQVGYFFLSPNGRTLVAQEVYAPWVTLWDWEKDQQRKIVLPPSNPAGPGIQADSSNHACFSPDSKLLATGVGAQSRLCLWDVATAQEVRRFECDATISAFSPDGKHLAAVSGKYDKGKRQNVLHLWEVATGKEAFHLPLEKEADDAFYWWIAFSRDGKKIAWVSTERISIRDRWTGKELHRFLPGRIRTVTFSPDGRTLVGTSANRIRLWDLTSGKEVSPRPGYAAEADTLAFSPDGQMVATASWIEGIGLWDAATGRQLRAEKETPEEIYVRNLVFFPDGSRLLSSHMHGEIHTWNTRTGQRVRALQLEDPGKEKKDYYEFYSYFLSAEGKGLTTLNRAFAEGGKEVSHLDIWESASGKHLKRHTFPLANNAVWAPDGQAVFFLTNQEVMGVDVVTGRALFHVPHEEGGRLALSPDGKLLAFPVKKSEDSKNQSQAWGVRLWETATGLEVVTLPTGPVKFVALADSRTAVTTDARCLRVYDISTAKELVRFAFPEGGGDLYSRSYGQGISLAPNGQKAVTSLADGTLLIWDLTMAKRPVAAAAKKLSAEELASKWEDLASENTAKAYQAMWRMADAPDHSLLFLRKQLNPAVEKDFTRVHQLIKDLDDDKFPVREAAFRELDKLGPETESFLRQVLQGKPSAEVRKRVEDLLSRPPTFKSPETLRAIRSIQVLEQIGSKNARQHLEVLAKGAPEARLTQEAKVALHRLTRRLGE